VPEFAKSRRKSPAKSGKGAKKGGKDAKKSGKSAPVLRLINGLRRKLARKFLTA
jgi:hypothetical protein